MKYLVVFLFVLLSGFLYHRYIQKIKSNITVIEKLDEDKRPKLWFYTDIPFTSDKQCELPMCLQLSIKSIYSHCGNSFNIINLHPDNINSYLPDMPIHIGPHSQTDKIQQKQIMISMIMYRYGGLWVPPNIIVLKNLLPITDKLANKEIVLFGCTDEYLRCSDKNLPNFEIVASRPYIKLWHTLGNQIIDNNKSFLNSSFEYLNLGRKLLWENCQNKYDIIHIFDSQYDGTRDYNKKLITNEELFSTNNILLQNEEKCMFVLYNYNNIYKSIKYNWFINLDAAEIMTGDLWISKIYRKSLLELDISRNYIYNTSTRNT
jgi:hypothetical protein